MSLFSADDHADMFSDPIGEPAIYTAFGQQAATIQVIFDDANKDTALTMGMLGGTQPQALCIDTDIPNIGKKDTMTVRGATYKVTDMQPDGTGLTLVILSKN